MKKKYAQKIILANKSTVQIRGKFSTKITKRSRISAGEEPPISILSLNIFKINWNEIDFKKSFVHITQVPQQRLLLLILTFITNINIININIISSIDVLRNFYELTLHHVSVTCYNKPIKHLKVSRNRTLVFRTFRTKWQQDNHAGSRCKILLEHLQLKNLNPCSPLLFLYTKGIF